jgi:hypothetical protein
MKISIKTLLLALIALFMFLQWQEARRATEAINILTEIYCEVTDAQDCDREVEVELQGI